MTALIMFSLAGFVLGGIVQEFWRGVRARRAVSREPVPLALVSLVRRNRRRYGGYLVHLGIITLFVGVAASSSFKTSSDVRCTRARRRGRRLRVHLREADRRVARGPQRAPGADRVRRPVERRKDGGATKPLRTSKDSFPSQDPSSVRSRASSTASDHRGRRSTPACTTTSGPPSRPTSSSSAADRRGRPAVRQGRRRPRAEQSDEFLALALRGLTDRYAQNPPPARFRSRSTRWSPGSGSAR